jgi:hypothetical protein
MGIDSFFLMGGQRGEGALTQVLEFLKTEKIKKMEVFFYGSSFSRKG